MPRKICFLKPTGDLLTVVFVAASKTSVEKAFALPQLTQADVAAADRYRQTSDKVAHAISAYLKRLYVGDWKAGASGKPVADGRFFNVSHTDGAVVFVMAERDVGIDVERVRPVSDDLKNYVASEAERQAAEENRDFFKVWTAKESLVKAHGGGLTVDVKTVPALPFDGVKTYKEKAYFSRCLVMGEYVISVTRVGKEPFDVKISTLKV